MNNKPGIEDIMKSLMEWDAGPGNMPKEDELLLAMFMSALGIRLTTSGMITIQQYEAVGPLYASIIRAAYFLGKSVNQEPLSFMSKGEE